MSESSTDALVPDQTGTEKEFPRRNQVAMLLFDERPNLDRATLEAATAKTLARLEMCEDKTFAFVQPEVTNVVAEDDGQEKVVPAMTTGFLAEGAPREMDLSQAWMADEDLRRRATGAAWHVMCMEMMAPAADPGVRLQAFTATIAALAEELGAFAVWQPLTLNLLPAADIVEHPIRMNCNVRLFTVSNDEGAIVMDTIGLDVVGLPDVQCHFTGLDPNAVGMHLYNVGAHLAAKGDVFFDGDGIDGLNPGEPWHVQHEDSLIPPHRLVVDLDPGDPHAAGGRQR